MATYDLEEQEQLAAFKGWWQEHGGAILLGATLVLAAIGGWNGWMWYQRSHPRSRGAVRHAAEAARANDLKTVRETAGAILENFPRSAYAPLAALVSAKVHFQAGDLKTARANCNGSSSTRGAMRYARSPRCGWQACSSTTTSPTQP